MVRLLQAIREHVDIGMRDRLGEATGVAHARARYRQIGWVADYLPDLESDFSVFHRVDDLHTMDGPRFLRFAWRIAAYDGMVARRIAAERDTPQPAPQQQRAAPVARQTTAPVSTTSRIKQPEGAQEVSWAQMALASPGLFEVVKVPKRKQ